MVDGRAPIFLHAHQETVVPLTIQNVGRLEWDPARIHVSYHWLWVIPRELARRSRILPYHEGIRTELAQQVGPGRGLDVMGRLLAPTVPGLYWLQWDMVEEGVTWFAQVSPRQPRQLVIVLPTLAGLFAPLPLLFALAGLAALRVPRHSGRAGTALTVAASADVLWCAAALFSKPLILIHDAVLEPTRAAYWLILIAAVVPPLVCLTVFARRVRGPVLFVIGAFGTLVTLGDAIHFRFFGDVLSASALLAARQTGHIWGSIRSLLTPGMLWFVLDVPLAAWLIVRSMRDQPADPALPRPRRAARAIAICVIAVAGAVPSAAILHENELDQMFRDRAVMEQLGPFGYHAYDAWNFARSLIVRVVTTPDDIERARAWFAARAPLRAGIGPYFGVASGRNLIVIQVESLQDFVVDYSVHGQQVMPHAHHWADDGLRFTNVTDETNEGRTSDAEFTTLASLLPLDHGAAAFRYSGNEYVGFPGVLGEHGYVTLSAVPFEPGFWNRSVMHPSYGFHHSLFESDFDLTEQIGWGLNDRDFLQQMVPRLRKLPRPFAAWLITLSLHHPFDDFPQKYKLLKLGVADRTPFGNYLHAMHFFDEALAEFTSSLARAGLLEDTMLVVFGDHDAGFQRESLSAQTLGIGPDAASWEINDRVPLFVKLPERGSDVPHGSVSLVAGQTDFAPTLLGLLGIDAGPLPYVGRNLLGRPNDVPVPRPFGDWLDRTHLFTAGGASDRAGSCYALATRSFVGLSACRAANESSREMREISRMVVAGDLQQQLREALR